MLIRKPTPGDLPAITVIYNYAIEHTVATFDTVLKTVEDREQWLSEHSDSYPVLVAEEDGHVIGWASLSRWSPRAAYDGTVEISIYFSPDEQGKGHGNELMKAIIDCGKQAGLHTVIARISDGNDISIHLHKKFGFTHTGTLKEVGYKFEQYIDVHIMQLMLKK